MAIQLVPQGTTRIETRVSNSRFIATLAPAASVEEAKAFIRAIREEMPGATHHVYAFRVGHGASVTDGMSDDGEPSGTSGPPVLAVLRGQRDLGDAVLVVTRFFGGTKLGTGGLVSAYGDAAKEVLAAAEFGEKVDRIVATLTVPYALHDAVVRLFADQSVDITDERFASDVTMRIQIPASALAAVKEKLANLSAGQITLSLM